MHQIGLFWTLLAGMKLVCKKERGLKVCLPADLIQGNKKRISPTHLRLGDLSIIGTFNFTNHVEKLPENSLEKHP